MRQIREPAELAADRPSVAWDKNERPKLQAQYTARLRRLLQLRREHQGELNQDGLWLLDRSIFATYCDCVEVGAGLAAQDILRSMPSSEGTGRTPVRPLRRPRRS